LMGDSSYLEGCIVCDMMVLTYLLAACISDGCEFAVSETHTEATECSEKGDEAAATGEFSVSYMHIVSCPDESQFLLGVFFLVPKKPLGVVS